MSNLENYRSSVEYREILRILQKSTALQENLMWQSHAMGKTVIPVQYLEIDFIAREVLVNFNSEHHHLNPELPLYIKLGYRTSVFKISDYRQAQDSVSFAFPEVIKTQELRSASRHQFRPAQEKFVTIKSLSANDAGSELKVRAMDASETGLGLVVSEQNRNFLKNNRVLWVTGLQESKLDHPVLAEIVYINQEVDPKFIVKRQKSLKVGIKVSGTFPELIYHRFVQ